MNLKEIKEMINLMNENGLVELEVEREGVKLKLKKTSGEPSTNLPRANADYRIESSITPKMVDSTNVLSETGKITKEITSPMVGTFYRSPSPEAAAFVEISQTVEIGQVVCIVEAMKLMNEIKSEIRGKIAEIAVENAEPVEFGQTLFVVEPL